MSTHRAKYTLCLCIHVTLTYANIRFIFVQFKHEITLNNVCKHRTKYTLCLCIYVTLSRAKLSFAYVELNIIYISYTIFALLRNFVTELRLFLKQNKNSE